ncbi:BQ5605_C009g05501 [Microbotryum silenes-dioicae]|uniref:BQ5605_C009g05501 protein n=1 Tax=Microbotryum silenes-dioicae TaxID=796604 RepID=A0A2X0MHF3_9BASI|nr:BQ5605_C009g05501 [Microbotryum silenes-dioicae]
MSSQSWSLLQADLLALSKEAGRRHADVREAAEKAHQLLKTNKEHHAVTQLGAGSESSNAPQPLYQPIFLAAATKNVKVIALAVSALQRLISAGAVPKSLVKQILETLEQVVPQGVEIQLKVLQTLVSLLTTTVNPSHLDGRGEYLVQGEILGQTLELSHRLSTSKIPVVASSASATLRQMFMFVFERVGEEDAQVARAEASKDPALLAALPRPSFNLDVPPSEHDAAAAPQHPEMASGKSAAFGEGSTSITLRPAARDAYLLLEDLCLLISGSAEGGPEGEPSFLRWTSLSRTFGLELVESIVSSFGPVVRTHPELLLVLRAHLCPLLIRFLSSPPSSGASSASSLPTFSFPLTLRLTRVVFLLLKQFADLLTLESEIFLTMFIRVIGPGDKGEGEGGHPSGPGGGNSPLWMRVLALEIFRGLCGDFELMTKFFQRYDAQNRNRTAGGGASSIFNDLMTALNRLATEKPHVLGHGAALVYGSSLQPYVGSNHGSSSASGSGAMGGAAAMLDSAMEMGLGLAQVAGNVVGSSVGAGQANLPGLSIASSTLKLQCIDQLDKAEAPPMPETYIFLLALQCLASLSDGFATYTLSAYSSIVAQQQRSEASSSSSSSSTHATAPGALSWDSLDRSEPKIAALMTVKDMAETSWPAFLASFSFFIGTNLDDDLFTDVVTSLQNFTSVCGVLGLTTPREAFLTSLCKFAIPPTVVAHLASQDSSTAHPKTAASVLAIGAESLGLTSQAVALPVGLSTRNLACLKALMSVAQYLAGSLDATWYAVFETLQNADYILKANATRNSKKRAAPTAPPATPPRGNAANSSTPMSPTSSNFGASGAASISKLPVQPTEADEQAVQASITKLFEVSKALDDEAFKWFVGSLCRLDGEMNGIPMTEDGQVADTFGTALATPLDGTSQSVSGGARRLSSGITALATQRLSLTSFGVSKLGVIALMNLHRLIYRDAKLGWNLVTSHLLLVLHHTPAPSTIRLQAAEVLDSILLVAPKNIATAEDTLQRRVQTQVLVALAEQAEPHMRIQTSTDIEIRRMALDTLFKILENDGHSFIAGWERIFHVLRTACPSHLQHPPPSPTVPPDGMSSSGLDAISEDGDRSMSTFSPLRRSTTTDHRIEPSVTKSSKNSVLVRMSFPSLQLICTDFLGALTTDELRDCIGTLADFGKQKDDVNVALTAGGLLWGVSDHLQAKRKEGSMEVAHGELWAFLLQQLLALCQDPRQEARDGAITTVFRSISLYGATLSKATWDATLWDVVFPLVENVSASIQMHDRMALNGTSEGGPGDELVSQSNGPPIRLVDKQWDDSKTLALKSMGDVFFDYLPLIVKTVRYEETWAMFVALLKRSFIEDRPQASTAAMHALEKVLSVSLDGNEASRISSSWEVAWTAWDEIGHAIAAAPSASHSAKAYTQVNVEAYVRVILPIYTPPYITFDLPRILRLLAILKVVLTYSRSPDFRPDIDSLTPLQAAILEVVAVIKLEVPGAASAVLSDLSEYLTYAFVASFDREPEAMMGAKGKGRPTQRITYVALSKEVMPHVYWLYQRYREDVTVYDQGAVEMMLAAYAIPLRLKHDCPASAKFSSAEPLWKTATVNFLKAVKDCVAAFRSFGDSVLVEHYEGVWRQIVNGFRGALLAESAQHVSASSKRVNLHSEENFDLALLATIEQDVLPFIGHALVPDDLIRRLGKSLQQASRLYELDLIDPTNDQDPSSRSRSSMRSVDDELSSTASSMKETRFDNDFDRQAQTGEMHGTTAECVGVGRERFAYWCFELLFLTCAEAEASGTFSMTHKAIACSDDEICRRADHIVERRRIAALCLPSLLNRCSAVLKTYIVDAPLRGRMPFPRYVQATFGHKSQRCLADLHLLIFAHSIRQEELTFVLQHLTTLRIGGGTLFSSTQPDPTSALLVPPPLTLDSPSGGPSLIRSALLRSPLGHLYELYPSLTALLSLSIVSPSITSAYIPYRRIVNSDPSSIEDEGLSGLPEGIQLGRIGRVKYEEGQDTDVVKLTLGCLQKVAGEIGC